MKTDVSFGLSGSGSATSGADVSNRRGDRNSGGGLPRWTIPLLIAAVFVTAIVIVIRR